MNLYSVTMPQLETMVVYGIGAFILYIVGLVAIVGYEIRQARQAQGIVSIYPYMGKAMVYIVGFLLFVTLFLVMATGALPANFSNPAMGIDAFFNNNWLDGTAMASLVKDGSEIKDNYTPEIFESAKTMVIVMMLAEFTYIILLSILFIMIFSFAFSVSGQKYKQAGEELDFGFLTNVLLTFVVSMITYVVICGVTSSLASSVLHLAIKLDKLPETTDTDIDITEDLALFVALGVEAMTAAITP